MSFRTASGWAGDHYANGRRTASGHRQRIEVQVWTGMFAALRLFDRRGSLSDKAGFHDAPLLNAFMAHYFARYGNEIAGVELGTETPTTGHHSDTLFGTGQQDQSPKIVIGTLLSNRVSAGVGVSPNRPAALSPDPISLTTSGDPANFAG